MILILAVAIAVMTIAFSSLNRLPAATQSSVSVHVGDLELVNWANRTSDNGWLIFTMVYSSGPTVSGPNSGLLIAVNGSTYFYPLSSFDKSTNPWSPYLVPGSVISFNSSSMGMSSPQGNIQLVTAGSYLTLEIISNSKEIWYSSQSVQPQAVKPVIANSWVVGSPNSYFHIYASVFSAYSVKVTGNFSLLYGGRSNNWSLNNVPMAPTGQEGYVTPLYPVTNYSFYEITAHVTSTVNSKVYHYNVSEWYPLGLVSKPINSGGTSAAVIFTLADGNNTYGTEKYSLTIGTYNNTGELSSGPSGHTQSYLVVPGTTIEVYAFPQKGQRFAGFSGYEYNTSNPLYIKVTHGGTLYLNYVQNAKEYSLALIVSSGKGVISVTSNSHTLASTNTSTVLTNLTLGQSLTIEGTGSVDYTTIPSGKYPYKLDNFVIKGETPSGNFTTNAVSITVSGNGIVTASFSPPKTYWVTILVNPGSSGDVNVTSGSYSTDVYFKMTIMGILPGTQLNLSASTTVPGYSFSYYSGNLTSSSPQATSTYPYATILGAPIEWNVTETAFFTDSPAAVPHSAPSAPTGPHGINPGEVDYAYLSSSLILIACTAVVPVSMLGMGKRL